MDFGLTDKTVLVLASGSGLGKAVAGEFLKEGALVVISGRGEEKLAAAGRTWKKSPAGVPAISRATSPGPGI